MLVNATSNPGPALWQGLMLLCLVWYLPWAFSGSPLSNNFRDATIAYVIVGIVLLFLIMGIRYA